MIAGEIGARSRHECSEAGYKALGAEDDVSGAVAEGKLELIDHLAGGIDREAVETQRRPRNVAGRFIGMSNQP